MLRLTQVRKGPNKVGFFGLLQTIIDRAKLVLLKVFFPPQKATIFFFYSSPLVGFRVALSIWFFLDFPFSFSSKFFSLLVFLILSSLGVFSLIWAGWGSFSVYRIVGGVRAVAQIISYEVVIRLIMIVFLLKTINVNFFYYFSFESSNMYFFLLLIFFLISFSAELNRTPFDLVEGESELVSGYNVEYSRTLFTVLFLSEYINIIFVSFLASSLFEIRVSGAIFVVFFFLLIRALLPRFKFFDLIFLCWLVLIPLIVLAVFFFLFYQIYYSVYNIAFWKKADKVLIFFWKKL